MHLIHLSPFLHYIPRISLNEQYFVRKVEKIAEKWKKRDKKKEEENENAEAITFKTHLLSESEGEILIPLCDKYEPYNKPSQIFLIECGKEKILVQVPKSRHGATLQECAQQKVEISVLKSLLDIEKIQCGPTGMFKGEIKPLHHSKMGDYTLEIVQFLIKQTYFSRRDHYKVLKALRDTVTHVFLRKTLYFDEIALEVHAMMKNSQTIVKSGIIDKNTKIIFRTSCSKLTVGIELSTETFQLNEKKELYLEKMIEFLYVYLQRSLFFNSNHRLTIIFYGRCFYPQFKTLEEAYDSMLEENSSLSAQQKFMKNFAVALQKDHKGRIYQDVYRRIIWLSDMLDNFREFVWSKINELLFTLNWNFSEQDYVARFINKSLADKMLQRKQDNYLELEGEESNNLKIMPFVHKLKSTLACSKDCNLFEAISLISEQYRHHYKFRSLTESGNTIILLSAGSSEYDVEETSYKMAKSYIYLTNIYCSLVNFKTKTEGPIKVNITVVEEKPMYKDQQSKKLESLSLHCIEKQFYISPTNEDMIIYNEFCNKNFIYPDELQLADPAKSQKLREEHHCDKQIHYQLIEKKEDWRTASKETKKKQVSFIHTYTMDDRYLHCHEHFYEKLQIIDNQIPPLQGNHHHHKLSELDIFEADLTKILITKKEWKIEDKSNELNKKVQNYRDFLENHRNRGDKNEKMSYFDRTSTAIFKINNYVEQNTGDDAKMDVLSSDNDGKLWPSKFQKRRRGSESYKSDILEHSDCSTDAKSKVNIFEETFKNKNHEYNAGQKEENKMKKVTSHNKERVKGTYPESNIHYIMPIFNDITLKKLKAFIKNEFVEEFKDNEEEISFIFQAQKMWKNLVFPLLTPIFTKYRANFKESQEHMGTGVTDETNDKRISILEDEVCKLLMKNYQIQEIQSGYNTSNITTKLSKGQVTCQLKMNGTNLARSYTVDPTKQEKIVQCQLYRYLSYEDKDCRFCSKYIYFKDKNKYTETTKRELQTKVVKLVLSNSENIADSRHTFSVAQSKREIESVTSSFASPSLPMKRDHFQDFIKMFNEKYKELTVEITPIPLRTRPKRNRFILNFSKTQSRALYNHEEVEIEIDIEYNLNSLFTILISWNLCSSVIIRDFVDNIMTMGRRSKLRPSIISSGNIFHTVWNITTIGQIIFEHTTGLDLLQKIISDTGEWVWDSEDFYYHSSGIAFIKFNREKKMILWRDNNHEKRSRDIKKDDSNRQYIKFFMKSAIFDFLGGIIDNVFESQPSVQ